MMVSIECPYQLLRGRNRVPAFAQEPERRMHLIFTAWLIGYTLMLASKRRAFGKGAPQVSGQINDLWNTYLNDAVSSGLIDS